MNQAPRETLLRIYLTASAARRDGARSFYGQALRQVCRRGHVLL